jgi:hypothetical protein
LALVLFLLLGAAAEVTTLLLLLLLEEEVEVFAATALMAIDLLCLLAARSFEGDEEEPTTPARGLIKLLVSDDAECIGRREEAESMAGQDWSFFLFLLGYRSGGQLCDFFRKKSLH